MDSLEALAKSVLLLDLLREDSILATRIQDLYNFSPDRMAQMANTLENLYVAIKEGYQPPRAKRNQ